MMADEFYNTLHNLAFWLENAFTTYFSGFMYTSYCCLCNSAVNSQIVILYKITYISVTVSVLCAESFFPINAL